MFNRNKWTLVYRRSHTVYMDRRWVLVTPFVSAERLVEGKLSKLVTLPEKKSHKKMQAEERRAVG
jgi:hypothetical protein